MAKRVSVIHEKTGTVYKTMSEAEKAFGIPSGMLSEAIKLGKPCRGEVFHVVDPNAVNNKKVADKSYPYVRAWAQFVHPDSEHFLKEYLLKAIADNAPLDAVFKCEGKWTSYREITNETTRKMLDRLMTVTQQELDVPKESETVS